MSEIVGQASRFGRIRNDPTESIRRRGMVGLEDFSDCPGDLRYLH
jgi:hypothetical protein